MRFPLPSLTVSWKPPSTVAVSAMTALSTTTSHASRVPPAAVAAAAVFSVGAVGKSPEPSAVAEPASSVGWPAYRSRCS